MSCWDKTLNLHFSANLQFLEKVVDYGHYFNFFVCCVVLKSNPKACIDYTPNPLDLNCKMNRYILIYFLTSS